MKYRIPTATAMPKRAPGNRYGGFICLAVVLLANFACAEDWPTYMHDNHRSGVTGESLIITELENGLGWVYQSSFSPQIAFDEEEPWDSYVPIVPMGPMREFDFALFVSVVGDSLYFGSSVTDSVHCLDTLSGVQKWFFTTDGPVRFPPSYDNGKLYFGSDDGCAYCLNAADGSLIWKYHPAGNNRFIGHNGKLISERPIRTGTAVYDGKVYFAGSIAPWKNSYIYSLAAAGGSDSGTGLYAVSTSGYTHMGAILVSDTNIYLTQGRRYPRVYNRSNGGGDTNIGSTAGDGGCYALLTAASGFAYGHGQDHGAGYELRGYGDSLGTYPGGRCMVVAADGVYVTTGTTLTKKHRTSGNTIWSVSCDCPYALILAGSVLFAGGTNKVVAFATGDGGELWSGAVNGHARGLAAAQGRLYVSTDTGQIRMFGASYLAADFNKNGIVDLPDLAIFVQNYLDCTDPIGPGCETWP